MSVVYLNTSKEERCWLLLSDSQFTVLLSVTYIWSWQAAIFQQSLPYIKNNSNDFLWGIQICAKQLCLLALVEPDYWDSLRCLWGEGQTYRDTSVRYSAGGQRWLGETVECSLYPNSFLLSAVKIPKYVLNLSFVSWETPLKVLLFVLPLPSLLFLQASLKSWLGFDHYIKSIRQSTEDFEVMLKRLPGSESGGGVMPGVKVSDITFAGVQVRVYEPPAGGEGHLRRGLMFFHGGGWALGSASEYERPCCL